jgi:hypothetical protein
MTLGLLIGTLIGAFAAFGRAKVGAIAAIAFIVAAAALVAAARSPHSLGRGVLIIAASQTSYLLVAYALQYLQKRASRHASQTAIGQGPQNNMRVANSASSKIINLVKALGR